MKVDQGSRIITLWLLWVIFISIYSGTWIIYPGKTWTVICHHTWYH